MLSSTNGGDCVDFYSIFFDCYFSFGWGDVMADYIEYFISMFVAFVKAIFELPFIGAVSYGYMLLGIYVVALLLFVLGSRLR